MNPPDSAAALLPPLYSPSYEHDACGTGFVATRSGLASHTIVTLALEALVNLAHRGAIDADQKTGDGAGLMLQVPRKLLAREAALLTGHTPEPGELGVGMLFLPSDDEAASDCQRWIEEELASQCIPLLTWRATPVEPEVLGAKARATMPAFWQVLVSRPDATDELAFERRLYLARRRIERRAAAADYADFYVASLSCRTIVYKGFFLARSLADFYTDLRDPDCESALAVFHQRYSTNTLPTWALAQPFRRLSHNGEINTLQGNRNWMRAREALLSSSLWGESIAELLPVIDPRGSDSASLDNVLELLELSGRDVLHALRMLVPEAWEQMSELPEEMRAFYAYHAALVEPWDGPAALAFSDGTLVGAALDRNGLRPARYTVTEDGLVVVASETGVIDLRGREVVERGRLGPGQMLAVNVATGELWHNDRIGATLANRASYRLWNDRLFVEPPALVAQSGAYSVDAARLTTLQVAFGFSAEDQRLIVQPMAGEGKEPLWSMGDDAPLAVLSSVPQPLASFFRQRFAQVTNPPIDPLRESLVTSLDTILGPRGSPLTQFPVTRGLLRLTNPFLLEDELAALAHLDETDLKAATVHTLFPVAGTPGVLERAVDALVEEAELLIEQGVTLLVLSDRGVDVEHAPIPMPLAVGALHHHLIRAGKRMHASIICDSGDVWDIHQAVVLFGYGASALCPYLALATARDLAGSRGLEEADGAELARRFIASLTYGQLKVMSKMGITALSSYQGAQLFEALGLSHQVIERCFDGTPSPIGGLDFDGLAERVLERHQAAFAASAPKLPDPGLVRFRKDGEYHAFNPFSARVLQQAAGDGPADYNAFVELIQSRQPAVLRDLLTIRPAHPIPLVEVESVEELRRRFIVTAMSLGALSPEAYRTLAIAMHRIGGRGNSGEGGEDPGWYYESGSDVAHSKIKQVASARFGVTAEYLSRAVELEIKIAQGSKPGEGGQLPAHKVTEFIARLRHAVPGVSLISPPPHHDIYSIEDLAQLIYDLKQINPTARVGVKLVASAGVGTIAAGVAKAYADYVLISGHSGGTGASPLSSIKHAGAPWELGLAETQQTLILNDLRSRITVRTDGGLQTARDVIIAALLGAEEFGFGTAPLVAMGCDMARQCHLNSCPTGIATQRPELRARFKGTPENVIAYFTHLAEEVRGMLAQIGARSLTDIVGRTELLSAATGLDGAAATLDPTPLLWSPPEAALRSARQQRNDPPIVLHPPLDETLLADALPALEDRRPVRLAATVRNHHRAIGARFAGEIATRFGARRPPAGWLSLDLRGQAGQSFGAWCTGGLRLTLTGEANDYVGKGMSGGEVIIRPPAGSETLMTGNVLLGNTVLYGATGGTLFAAGRAGERFAVRNSGATAVVEGVGDHGCEYMTGGVVVVLGSTGRNFAAGMTNGTAYVFDPDGLLPTRHNPELVHLLRVVDADDAQQLHALLEQHVHWTGSAVAQTILDDFEGTVPAFWKVTPKEIAVAEATPARRARRVPAAQGATS